MYINLGPMLNQIKGSTKDIEGNCGLCEKCLLDVLLANPVAGTFGEERLREGVSSLIFCQDCRKTDCPKSSNHTLECVNTTSS